MCLCVAGPMPLLLYYFSKHPEVKSSEETYNVTTTDDKYNIIEDQLVLGARGLVTNLTRISKVS